MLLRIILQVSQVWSPYHSWMSLPLKTRRSWTRRFLPVSSPRRWQRGRLEGTMPAGPTQTCSCQQPSRARPLRYGTWSKIFTWSWSSCTTGSVSSWLPSGLPRVSLVQFSLSFWPFLFLFFQNNAALNTPNLLCSNHSLNHYINDHVK